MKIDYIKKSEIPKIESYRKTKYQKLFDEFLKSDAEVMRITPDPGKKVSVLRSNIYRSIKRFHLGIKVMQREDYVYLVKT